MAQIKYCTVAEVKAILGIAASDTSKDVQIDAAIDEASAYIDQQTNRKFGYASDNSNLNTVTLEEYKVESWGGFYLRNPDVLSPLTTVRVGSDPGTILVASDYEFDTRTGRLYTGNVPTTKVYVSYKWGHKGVPEPIRFAAKRLAAGMSAASSGSSGGTISAERIGNYQVNYKTASEVATAEPRVADVIKQYRFIKV